MAKKTPNATVKKQVISKTNSERIRITKMQPVTVNAGNRNGIYFTDFIDAVDTKTNEPITKMSFGAAKYGRLIVEAGAHWRYFPPQDPCQDEMRVTLETKDGVEKEIFMPIQVTKPTNEQSELNW